MFPADETLRISDIDFVTLITLSLSLSPEKTSSRITKTQTATPKTRTPADLRICIWHFQMPETLIFCSCFEPNESTTNKYGLPLTIWDDSNFHDLNDLYFCVKCQSVKCPQCSEIDEVASKYCPQCNRLHQLSEKVCNKGCFLCSKCDCPVRVESEVYREDGKIKSKSFSLTCDPCELEYHTGAITKPAFLYKIVQKQDVSHERFRQLVSAMKPAEKIDTVSKLEALELARRTRLKGKELQKEIEIKRLLFKDEKVKPPRPQPLTGSFSMACMKCHSTLVKPEQDAFPGKFEHLSSARHYLPQVSICKYLQQDLELDQLSGSFSLLLNFFNHGETPMEVSVSSFEKLDSLMRPIMDETGSSSLVELSVPVSNFTLGVASRELVKNIPTVYLTELTKISRVEKIKRVDAQERLLYSENDFHMGEPLDQGSNWCTVPIYITITDSENSHLIELPVFIGIKGSAGVWMKFQVGRTRPF